MRRRYLFGPVTAAFAADTLAPARRGGECLAFGPAGEVDLAFDPLAPWDDLAARLPTGWRPDFVVLRLPPAAPLPARLFAAPVPVVGVAESWRLRWHYYRRALRRCDLVLADTTGAAALAAAGLPHVRPVRFAGCGLQPATPDPSPERDIDVLFVSGLRPAADREDLPWVGRLAVLADRWRVVIRKAATVSDCRALLRRARVVVTRPGGDEPGKLAAEAAAAGALVFAEGGDPEAAPLANGHGCVLYDERTLDDLLAQYLGREDDRLATADAGRVVALRDRPESLWERALDTVAWGWDDLCARAKRRAHPDPDDELLDRTWQAVGPKGPVDAFLVRDLSAAVAVRPDRAALHTALGLAVTLGARGKVPATRTAGLAAEHFGRALERDPDNVAVAVNLAEALAAADRAPAAIAAARRGLATLDRLTVLSPGTLDTPHYPPGVDLFRVEWERAGWANAGRPGEEARAKRDLLAWRLHGLLARLTDDVHHRYEAALARPDLPATRATLGSALVARGRTDEPIVHLRQAVAGNPLDGAAARALYDALRSAGLTAEADRLAADRRRLRAAADEALGPEPWVPPAQPAGDGLASVIIPCCNEVGYTRLCVESVLRHTRRPYELIFIDNGSTDETPDYLAGVGRRPGPERVVVLRNAENRGFPPAVNQGLAAARGEFLVLLNNDCVVGPGWLDALVGCATRGGPAAGLVGAVSNGTRPPQRVEPGYSDLSGLNAFAELRARQFAGRVRAVDRLAGFCLLLRRTVYEAVGGLDERYGVGYFDDDDLSVRARRAGFQLLVAPGAYVHHFGSRTFHALGIDAHRQLEDNLARFREKWGDAEAARYRLPAAPGRPRPRVSLCMIVRNEAANLPDCLAPAAGLFDEVVVVDTGSTDRTKEVAAAHGARVFDFPWRDSFAAARNESLDRATGDWAFWLDADDRLDEPNRARLQALLAALPDENVAYLMTCQCPSAAGTPGVAVAHARLFRRLPGVRWRYRVHEQILLSVHDRGGVARESDVVIAHEGYRDPALYHAKLDRNRRLLELDAAEAPDDPFVRFYQGYTMLLMGRHAEAVPFFRHSRACAPPGMSIIPKIHALLGQCLARLGGRAEALAAYRDGLRVAPRDAELMFLEATLLQEAGDRAAAEARFLALLDGPAETPYSGVDAGTRGYKARHNLAVLYRDAGRYAEAERAWEAVVAEEPGFAPAWLGLGELYLARGRGEDARRVLDGLEQTHPAAPETAALRARHQARRPRGQTPAPG